MEHINTIVKFKDKNDDVWAVSYEPNGWAHIEFNSLPFYNLNATRANTKTKHPNKTKSLELIRIAKKQKKEEKEKDKEGIEYKDNDLVWVGACDDDGWYETDNCLYKELYVGLDRLPIFRSEEECEEWCKNEPRAPEIE